MESINIKQKRNRCHVPQCARDVNASMHIIPFQSKKKNTLRDLIRKQWLNVLNIESTETDFVYYVCSNHFLPEDFKDRRAGTGRARLKNDAVPSVNLPAYSTESSCVAKYEIPHSSDTEDAYENDNENHKDADQKCPQANYHEEAKESPETYDECFHLDLELQDIDEIEEFFAAQVDASIQVNLAYDESLRKVSLLDMFRDTADLFSWTGIPSFVALNNINFSVNHLSSAAKQIPEFKTSTENLIIIVMSKLKTNLHFTQLSVLFGVATKTLIKYFFEFVPILRAVLECRLSWSSKEEVAANIPNRFTEYFSDCMAIMDCPEGPIKLLKNLTSRIKKFSHCKGTYTVKVNITVTPSGLIMNASSAWGGKASDKHIVLQKQILENFTANDGLMIDKECNISEETKSKGIKSYRPLILDKPQFTSEEAVENTTIAKAPIHVERVMQQIKQWKIFHTKISKTILKVIDDIVLICCAMVNLSPPILASDKF